MFTSFVSSAVAICGIILMVSSVRPVQCQNIEYDILGHRDEVSWINIKNSYYLEWNR